MPRLFLAALVIAPAALPQESITLTTDDRAIIAAQQFGSGRRGLVLAHGGRFTKESWAPQAHQFAAAGFLTVAIDFRGFGQSQGPGESDMYTAPLHLDVLAAVRYLHGKGIRSVSIVGGSFGGDAAAAAAAAKPGEIDRLVLLAATPDVPPEKLTLPKLFLVARDDSNGAGPRLPGLRAYFSRSPAPRKLIVLEGSAHAQFLFQTNQGPRVMREILRFLR